MSISDLKIRRKRIVGKNRNKLSFQPGKTVGGLQFDPIETHPMWHNLAGIEDSVLWLRSGVIYVHGHTGDVPDQPIAYSKLTMTDFDIGAVMLHPGSADQCEIYMLAGRMTSDFNTFIGATMWQGKLSVYEKNSGVWQGLIDDGPDAVDAVGKLAVLRALGNTVELEVEGLGLWSATTSVSGSGRIGCISRDWKIDGAPLMRNFRTVFWERLRDSTGELLNDSNNSPLYAPVISGKLRMDKMRSF